MLEEERKMTIKHEQEDIMQIKKYVLNKNNILEYRHNDGEIGSKRPYLPVKISCKENGMSIDTKSLIDTGADKAVVSHETVRKLNMKVKPTNTKARDAGGRALPILGEVTLDFSCTCRTHKGKKTVSQTALVLQNVGETCLITFDMSIKLELLTFNCVTDMSQIQKVNCKEEDDEEKGENEDETELEGEEIVEDIKPPNTKHLSPEMLRMAEKFPKVLKD